MKGLCSGGRVVSLRELEWKPTGKDWKSSDINDELPEVLKEKQGLVQQPYNHDQVGVVWQPATTSSQHLGHAWLLSI